MGFVMWLSAADVTCQHLFVCVHAHMCAWQQMVGVILPQANGQCTGYMNRLCWLQQRHSLSVFLLPPSPHPLPFCIRQVNGWLSLSVPALLFHHPSLCWYSHSAKNVRPVFHSLHPSSCLSDPSSFWPPLSSVHPSVSVVPLRACVFSVCWFVVKVYMCCVFICLCWPDCYPSPHPPPPSPSQLSVCESRSVGICQQTPPLLLTHAHPNGFCALCPSSHLDVPTTPASAPFSSGLARLCGLITGEPTTSVTSAVGLIEI